VPPHLVLAGGRRAVHLGLDAPGRGCAAAGYRIDCVS